MCNWLYYLLNIGAAPSGRQSTAETGRRGDCITMCVYVRMYFVSENGWFYYKNFNNIVNQ